MVPSTFDPCLFSKLDSDSNLIGLVALQVDDVFGFGSKDFLKLEENQSTIFKSKPRKILEPGDEATFNGTTIKYNNDHSFSLVQTETLEA